MEDYDWDAMAEAADNARKGQREDELINHGPSAQAIDADPHENAEQRIFAEMVAFEYQHPDHRSWDAIISEVHEQAQRIRENDES